MKKLLARALMALILLGAPALANAAVWTLYSCYGTGNGYVIGNFPHLTLVGDDNSMDNRPPDNNSYSDFCYTTYTATFEASRRISFDWLYHSGDPGGSV